MNPLILACLLYQLGTVTPTVTPTDLPYCQITPTPYQVDDPFDLIDPIDLSTATPVPAEITATYESLPTSAPAVPTISPSTWRWVSTSGFTAYGSNVDVIRTFTIPDVCYGGEVKGYHIQHTHIQNGQNAGYHYTLQGMPTKDYKNTTTNSLIRNQEFWVVQSANAETVPSGIPNITSASRPNIDQNLHAPLTFIVEIGAGSTSYPFSYLQVNTLELLCSGGHASDPNTGTPVETTVTPEPCREFSPLVEGDPVAEFGYERLDEQCYNILGAYHYDFAELPDWLTSVLDDVINPLPVIDVPGIAICLTPLNVTAKLLNIDMLPTITALMALVCAGLVIGEFRS